MTEDHDPTAFILGERIKLCAVRGADIGPWAGWFNDPVVTQFLEQGQLPNSIGDQEDFLASARTSGRFLAMVRSRATDALLGVISLSEINRFKGSAQIALVVPGRCDSAPFAALEAMAQLTEHALTQMRLTRTWAGQAYPGLAGWNARLELIGYRTEGVQRSAFVSGNRISDAVMIAAHKSGVDELAARRGGSLWPGTERLQTMVSMRRELANQPTAERIAQALHEAHNDLARQLVELDEAASLADSSPTEPSGDPVRP